MQKTGRNFFFPIIQRRRVNHHIWVVWGADGKGEWFWEICPQVHTDISHWRLSVLWLAAGSDQSTNITPPTKLREYENWGNSLHIEPILHIYLLNGMGNEPGTISGGQWVFCASESCTLKIKYLQNHKGTMQGSYTPECTWKTSQHSSRLSKVSRKQYKPTRVWSMRHIPFKLFFFLKRCWII